MSIYNRILVATDFSDINLLAVKRAVRLAKLDSCELIILHVIEHFPMGGDPLASVFQSSSQSQEAMTRHVQTRLDELRSKLDYEQIRTELRISSKSARSEILHFADAHEIDLIIVAPHGQGIIGSLGSTATGVINNAKCDVLAVRDAEATD